MIDIINFFKGYVVVSANGFFAEKFINLCIQKNICIYDIKNISQNTYSMKMSIKAYKSTKKFALRTSTELKIIKKAGFPFFMSKICKRKGIAIGMISAVVLFFLLTSFIWEIDIKGNKNIKNEEIVSALNKCGFKKGMFRFGINQSELQNKLLLELDGLSWIWVYINGTKAVVDIREKVPVPDIVDKNKPSNIISKSNALVTEIIAKSGNACVKVGDTVNKGDILINGVVNIGETGFRYVNSQGSIIGRTWYEKNEKIPLIYYDFKKTGKKIKKKVVNLMGFDVLLYVNKSIPYKHYDKNVKEKSFSLFGITNLPVKYTEYEYEEKEKTKNKITVNQAVGKLKKELELKIESELDSKTEILDKTYEYAVCGNNVNVKVIYECKEEIGEKVYIE